MNTPKIADYTTRKSYQQDYAKENREAINARKREWRAKQRIGTLSERKGDRDLVNDHAP